jgi:hypothetical protein
MSKHRKASGPKPAGGKKQKINGKKELKDKTVAAEIGAAVMREEAPKPAPAPIQRSVAPAAAPPVAKADVTEPPHPLLGATVDTFERSFKAVGQGTIAVNRKLLDFARANMSSGFDFAMSLASASSPAQIMQLQMNYWDERLKALASQAQELRALSAELVANTNEPIRQHMRTKRAASA